MENYIAYLEEYSGIGKAYRALQYANDQQQKSNKQILVDIALNIAKEENLIGYYDQIMKETQTQIRAGDIEWYQEQKVKNDQQIQNKIAEINSYKNQKNNQSTRISMVELAKLYLQVGNISEAAKSFDKANTYRMQTDSIIDYIDDYSTALLFNKDYEKLLILQTEIAGVVPNQVELKEKVSVSYTCQLLRSLMQQDYNEFMEICKNRLIPDDLPDNINNIATVKDLGNYITVAGLFKNRKLVNKKDFTHFHVLYNNENVSPLIVGSFNAQHAADSYVQMKYAAALDNFNKIINQDLQYDPFLQNKTLIINTVQRQILIDYMKPFKRIEIAKIAKEFGYETEILIKHLQSMISDQKGYGEELQVNFLIDPIEGTLVQRVTEETRKIVTYNKAVKTIEKYLAEKKKNLLQLQQLMREGKDKMFMMDEYQGEDMIQRALQGF